MTDSRSESLESTQPFPSSFLEARLAEIQAAYQPEVDQLEDEDSTQRIPVPMEEVTPDSALEQEFFTAPQEFHQELGSELDHSPVEDPDASGQGKAQSQQHTRHQLADVPLDQLNLHWDPRVRLVFKRPRDLAFKTSYAEQQEVIVSPKPGLSEQPLWVNLLGCLQSKNETMFSLAAGTIQCDLFYIPDCNDIILCNKEDCTLTVCCPSYSDCSSELGKNGRTTPSPGTWKISTAQHSLEFQLWPRRYSLEIEETRILGKRSSEQATLRATKRRNASGRLLSSTPAVPPPLTDSESSLEGKTACIAYSLDDQAWFDHRFSNGQKLKVRDEDPNEPGYSLRYLSSKWERRSRNAYAFKAVLSSDSISSAIVVVKHFPAGSNDEMQSAVIEAAKRWSAEFTQHRRLNHPRIARLLDFDARIHTLYVEYKDSTDLGSIAWRTQTGSFKGGNADARRILADVSSALVYLEKERLVHNDIKPGNILYCRDSAWTKGGAVLIDFGLAKKPGSVCNGGTPWYVAPEYAKGQREFPADIWSLGVSMLYLMKYTTLPEKLPQYPAWKLANIRGNTGSSAQMKSWLNNIKSLRDNLQINPQGQYEDDIKLGICVSKMLESSVDNRITARELAHRTEEWASEVVAI